MDLHAIAVRFLAETGNPEPSRDARALAACFGWRIQPHVGVAGVLATDGKLYFDPRLPGADQQRMMAETIARHVLLRYGGSTRRYFVERLAPMLVVLA